MKSMLSIGLAMLGVLSLSAASLMPEKGKISIAGGNGCNFKAQDDCLVISREKPGIQQFMQGMLRFNPALDSNFATFDALVLEIKVPQDITLRTRWRKTDKSMLNVPDTQIKGSSEFQTVAVRLPQAPDRQLESLSLDFFPEQPEILIRKIAIEQPAKVTLEQAGDVSKVQKELMLRGVTAEPNSEVVITLKNSRGEAATRTVRSDDKGLYELKWPRPPVNIWYWNTVSAAVNGGKNAADVSLELPVFGYFAADSYLWLKVKGKQIVTSPDAAGGEQPFIPVGIGYCRDVILPAQDEQVMKYCKERNLNTVRLPFYTRFFNNRDTEPLNIDEHIRDFILPVVLAAKRNNLYVILDDHGYFTSAVDESKAREKQQTARWSEEGVNEWIARWVKVAEYFKDDPTVLGYELLNEPHDISPELTREWYTRCLKAIRKVDQRHIIILGNADWSHSRAMEKTWGPTASTVDAPYNNVVFSFHDYPEDNHPWDVAKFITAFRDKNNVPVLCTEFGATHWNKGETVCRTFIGGMLTLCAKEDVGWMIWALHPLKDNPRAPYNNIDNVGINPPSYDSCSYSDMWIPAAKIMASPFPKAK